MEIIKYIPETLIITAFILMACSPLIYMLLQAETPSQKRTVIIICVISILGILEVRNEFPTVIKSPQVNILQNNGEIIE